MHMHYVLLCSPFPSNAHPLHPMLTISIQRTPSSPNPILHPKDMHHHRPMHTLSIQPDSNSPSNAHPLNPMHKHNLHPMHTLFIQPDSPSNAHHLHPTQNISIQLTSNISMNPMHTLSIQTSFIGIADRSVSFHSTHMSDRKQVSLGHFHPLRDLAAWALWGPHVHLDITYSG